MSDKPVLEINVSGTKGTGKTVISTIIMTALNDHGINFRVYNHDLERVEPPYFFHEAPEIDSRLVQISESEDVYSRMRRERGDLLRALNRLCSNRRKKSGKGAEDLKAARSLLRGVSA